MQDNKIQDINTTNIGIEPTDFKILLSPAEFRKQLLEFIRNAKNRIYICALYLENDDAGYEVLEALHKAKEKNKNLDIKVLIDFHRAQRGLIGAEHQKGNIAGYYEYKKKYNSPIEIYGVPVKTREVFGVFHLKGFVIDETVIYSGASLNNVYLNYTPRYRLDRYFVIESKALANSFVDFYHQHFFNNNNAVSLFEDDNKISIKSIKKSAKKFSKEVSKAYFEPTENKITEGIITSPIFGLGKKDNKLNETIVNLIKSANSKLTIYTPYFNLPSIISKEIITLLKKKNVEVSIIIGDKTANDFFISPEQEFKKISIIPYLYEQNLKNFVEKQQQYIDEGLLNIFLWKNDNNTFHLKGVEVDDKYRLITGNNLNPRGWKLDMENGILITDTNKLLKDKFEKEYQIILKNCHKIVSTDSLDSINDYPKKVKKYVKNIYRFKIDKIMKRMM